MFIKDVAGYLPAKSYSPATGLGYCLDILMVQDHIKDNTTGLRVRGPNTHSSENPGLSLVSCRKYSTVIGPNCLYLS